MMENIIGWLLLGCVAVGLVFVLIHIFGDN